MSRGRTVILAAAAAALPASVPVVAQTATRYVRFADGDRVAFGLLEGETVAEPDGDLFDAPKPTGRR